MAALLDANVWLAILIKRHPGHKACSELFSNAESQSLLFCRSTHITLVRLLTTLSVTTAYKIPPLSNCEALDMLAALEADPRTTYAEEPAGTDSLWRNLASSDSCSPKVWMDAYLAAFALAGNYEFVTLDKGFADYSGLNPTILSA